MTAEELEKESIVSWKAICESFRNTDLLLGNGFSLNISPQFHYESLYDEFKLITAERYTDLFKLFKTTNFEKIQEYLTYARVINTHHKISTAEVEDAYTALKQGLISVVQKVHPRVSDIDKAQILSLSDQFINGFNDVYTTNYDLILYQMIMESVDSRKSKRNTMAFQDYYWGTLDEERKQFMGYQGYPNYKHVYYLHGALFLFNSGDLDYKIIRKTESVELIELIQTKIQADSFPLFVSEGTSADKLRAIRSNSYLDFCLQSLKIAANPLLVFGLSLADNDAHIIDAIKSTRRSLIIAIYVGNRAAVDVAHEVAGFRKMFAKAVTNLQFVDSTTVFQF